MLTIAGAIIIAVIVLGALSIAGPYLLCLALYTIGFLWSLPKRIFQLLGL